MYKILAHSFSMRHRSVQIFLICALYLILAPYLPKEAHRAFYTFSLFIKDLLIWLLPLSVGFFIAYAVSSFEKKAPLFLLTLFLFEAISNGCSVWYAYFWGSGATHTIHPIQTQLLLDHFTPLWRWEVTKPSWWTADKGTIMGVCLGLIAIIAPPRFRSFLAQGKRMGEIILTKFFSRLIPLFVLGFLARMHETQLLSQMASQYSSLLLWLILAILIYLTFLFILGSGLTSPSLLVRIQNLLPAAGISFSSGCSLSTMPWTIEGTAKNLNNKNLAQAIIPATTNIQQIGDCITNSFLCVILCYQFQGSIPDLYTWTLFSFSFILARFATAAVLGGAIFVMIPIYESTLHFTPEMISIILALNVILDPLVTCSNVVANGALCRIFEKVWEKRPVSVNRKG